MTTPSSDAKAVSWQEAIVFISVWLLGTIVIGAAMWPVSKQPLVCYVRASDLDLIGIGGVVAAFSWTLTLRHDRVRDVAIAALLVVLTAAEYFHLGGSDLAALARTMATALIPVGLYIWLFDRSELFDTTILIGPAPVPMRPVRKLLREKAPFFLTAPGMAVAMLVFALATAALIVFGVAGPLPPVNGICQSIH